MSESDWPFDQPRNCATLTLRSIVFGGEPILFVSHDADDHGWQFLNGKSPDSANATIVALSEIVDHDPTVLDVADLRPGWVAERDDRASPWQRKRHEGP